jgi:hypothetical protein
LRTTTNVRQDILVDPWLGSARKLDDKLTATLLFIMRPCVANPIVLDLKATRLKVYQSSAPLWFRPNANIQHCG